MSMASGITVEGGRKTSSTLLREHRGFRLALAFAAVALCWGWSLNWASGRSLPGVQTMGQQLWQFAPFFVGLSVSLICLGWASKLFWDGLVQSRDTAHAQAVPAQPHSQLKPWIAGHEVKAIATVLFAGIVLCWGVGYMSGDIAPANARGMFLASGAALWIVLVGAFFSMLRRKANEGNWRKVAPVLIAPPLMAMAFTAIVNDPAQAAQQSPLFWSLRLALVATILFIPASTLPGLLPMWLVQQGKFDLALRFNRLFFWAVGNTKSTEGWILVMAGRYQQAQSYLKPLAFDKKGHPRLNSQEFYLYSLALSIDGQEAAAELLFEAAVNAPQNQGNFHFGLAECLLAQGKDLERANELVEIVLAGYPSHPRSKQQRADRAQMIAFNAWALAANGRHEQAHLRLEEALQGSAALGKCGLAGLHLPVGQAWLSLGEPEKARASFQEAIRLFPAGDIAIRAHKNLAHLDRS